MRTTFQATDAYELIAQVSATPYGHELKLISHVPCANRPEEQVKFQGLFSDSELRALNNFLTAALEGAHAP